MDIGAVIGQFQIDNLTEGHLFLINTAFQNHRKVVVLLGVDPNTGTKSNPLDYFSRERMIRTKFPVLTVLPLNNQRRDDTWSQHVDDQLRIAVPNISSCTIYGGRESFIPHYKGQWKTVEIDSGLSYVNVSQKRHDIGRVIIDSCEWRKGIIYAIENMEKRVVPAVLVACIHKDKNVVLLKRHKDDEKWSFPGTTLGAVHESLEAATRHTLGLWLNATAEGMVTYLSSGRVNLWHFRTSHEITVMASLMRADYVFGSIKMMEGYESKWFSLNGLANVLVEDQLSLFSKSNREK